MAKLITFEFRCQNSECAIKFDDLVTSDIKESTCPECGGMGNRIISMGRIDPKLGVDPDSFGTLGDKWARTREQHHKIMKKRQEDHGPDG
jgi:hypothetical protein